MSRTYTDLWSFSANPNDQAFSQGEMLALVNRRLIEPRAEKLGYEGALALDRHGVPHVVGRLAHVGTQAVSDPLPWPFTDDQLDFMLGATYQLLVETTLTGSGVRRM